MEHEKEEDWRAIIGWEGLYEVSSLGRVRSLDRKVTRSDGVVQSLTGKDLKLRPHPGGYVQVGLHRPGYAKDARVHRLVCEAFHGPPPFEGAHVLHADDNPANNLPDNLRWGTRSENMADWIRIQGGHHQSRKTHCKRGHEFSEENTSWFTRSSGSPYRRCKACAAHHHLKGKPGRAGKEPPTHGTDYAYEHYKCRCDTCRTEKARRKREYRQRVRDSGRKPS